MQDPAFGARAALEARERAPLTIDSQAEPRSAAGASSTKLVDMSSQQWERLSGQRDVMIGAMVRIFTFLNGGVYVFTLVAWIAGLRDPTYRIVDNRTILTLIGATVVQSGIAFIAITRFLFPSAHDAAAAPPSPPT